MCENLGEMPDEQSFWSLNLKATMKATWIQAHLGVKWPWWVENNKTLPILREILEAIEAGKVRNGGASRLSKKADVVVALKICGKVIFVLNRTSSVVLCWRCHEETETLTWLVSELQKDKEPSRQRTLRHVPRRVLQGPPRRGKHNPRRRNSSGPLLWKSLETILLARASGTCGPLESSRLSRPTRLGKGSQSRASPRTSR